jgi:hypothetical protein
MMKVAQVTAFSRINTTHINTVWAERKLLHVKLVGASRNL